MKLSIVIPVYLTGSHDILFKSLEMYSNLSSNIKKELEIIVVDDHCTTDVDITDYINKLNVSLYRIDDDIPWNQPGARNLGCLKSSSKWIYVIDVDHYIPESTITYIMNNYNKFRVMEFRYFYRMSINGDDLKRKALNKIGSVLISKTLFEEVGGWDERFSGNYGFDDAEFAYRCNKIGTCIKEQKYTLININASYNPKSSDEYHNLVRSSKHNRNLTVLEGKPSSIINFKWHKVS